MVRSKSLEIFEYKNRVSSLLFMGCSWFSQEKQVVTFNALKRIQQGAPTWRSWTSFLPKHSSLCVSLSLSSVSDITLML